MVNNKLYGLSSNRSGFPGNSAVTIGCNSNTAIGCNSGTAIGYNSGYTIGLLVCLAAFLNNLG